MPPLIRHPSTDAHLESKLADAHRRASAVASFTRVSRFVPVLLIAALGLSACQPKPSRPPNTTSTPAVTQVPGLPEVQFASSTYKLLIDGGKSRQRDQLLSQVVQAQMRHARVRFEMGQDERGLQSTMGALFLVRTGELQPAMFNEDAAVALEHAYRVVAPLGDEGAARALLTLQLEALPTASPQRAVVSARLQRLARWTTDTRNHSDVENAMANVVADGTSSTLNPTAAELERARAAAEKWIAASLDLHHDFDRIKGTLNRDMVVDASRGLRVGPATLSALFLRNGNAAGALASIEQTRARALTAPALLDALQKAEAGDPQSWRDLAGLYLDDAMSDDGSSMVPKGIARGALWGCTLRSYQLEPTSSSSAISLATLLETFGMPEVGATVLSKTFSTSSDPATVGKSLDLALSILRHENASHDDDTLQRTFTALQPLLSHADNLQKTNKISPSPSSVRRAMAGMDISAAHLDQAAWLLRQVTQTEPTADDYLALARIAQRDPAQREQAKQYLERVVGMQQVPGNPLPVLQAHLALYQLLRDQGNADEAQKHLLEASSLLDKVQRMKLTPTSQAVVLRFVARLAYFTADDAAWRRALQKLRSLPSISPAVTSISLISITSLSLLRSSPDDAEEILERLADNASEDDLAYAGLWTLFARTRSGEETSRVARRALERVTSNAGWPYWLAQWGLGKMNDEQLQQKAHTFIQRSEASFYIGLRDFLASKPSGRHALEQIARGPAIDLVETFLAQELTRASP